MALANEKLGYKIFQSDWSCLGYQYQVGKVHDFEGEIQMEKSGFHFCARALDCMRYYPLDPRRKYAQVKASNQIITVGDKSVTNRLQIIKEITPKGFIKLCTGVLKTAHAETTYENGLKKGKAIEFHTGENQTVKVICHYDNNKLHGLSEEFDRKGTRTFYNLYRKGQIIHQFTQFLDGKIRVKQGCLYSDVCEKIPNLGWGLCTRECDERELRLYCAEFLKSY